MGANNQPTGTKTINMPGTKISKTKSKNNFDKKFIPYS